MAIKLTERGKHDLVPDLLLPELNFINLGLFFLNKKEKEKHLF